MACLRFKLASNCRGSFLEGNLKLPWKQQSTAPHHRGTRLCIWLQHMGAMLMSRCCVLHCWKLALVFLQLAALASVYPAF